VGAQVIVCPACKEDLPRTLARRQVFDCSNCGVALQPIPNPIATQIESLFGLARWTFILICLFRVRGIQLGFWGIVSGLGVIGLVGDSIASLFPATEFKVVGGAIPAPYRNIPPLSNAAYNQRWKTIHSLGIT